MGAVMIASADPSVLWPGGEMVAFGIADVAALGRERNYGSFVTRYRARLRDGREVGLTPEGRTKEEQRWLASTAKRIKFTTFTTRDCPQLVAWLDLAEPSIRGFR